MPTTPRTTEVSYGASLELMAEADLLLVLDAPGSSSPFFPSKLADYVGAGRPILALSPSGPSARLVRDLGGWVADPADIGACAQALIDAVTQIARIDPTTLGRRDYAGIAGGRDRREALRGAARVGRFR